MRKNERPFCLIKFGKKEHLESLQNNGDLFFNKTENFNKAKNINEQQGDENEGAEWIENVCLRELRVNHATLGEHKFKPDPKTPWKFTQFNHNYLTCSFLIITTKDFEDTHILKIDERMLEFGDYALIIKNPKIFLDDIIETMEVEDLEYSARKVEYKDLKIESRIEMNPFIKKIEHQHQKEYRIVIKNNIEPKLVRLKPVGLNGELVKSKFIVESKWEVSRE